MRNFRLLLALSFLGLIVACQSDNKTTPVETEEYNPSVEDILDEYPASDRNVPNNEFETPSFEPNSNTNMDASHKIDPSNLDAELLIGLIEEGINIKRIEEGRMILRINDVLGSAAMNQNSYQVLTGQLSHTQDNSELRDVRDRVNRYGGQFRTVGENVQFQGFQIMIRNGRKSLVQPAYQKAADEIVQNWINSPGHYRNLINNQFDQVGTAVGWSDEKNAIFATQVFGG